MFMRNMHGVLAISLFLAALTTVNSATCNVAMDTDIILAIHDSSNTLFRWWGGFTINPGISSFIRTFTSTFNLGQVRIAIIAYGTTVRVLSPFSDNRASLDNAAFWNPEFGGARTYDALNFIGRYFQGNGRPNVAKVAVMVTGISSDNFAATQIQAAGLRGQDVSLIGVGYNSFALSELYQIAGGNNVIYTINSFMLSQYVTSVERRVCALTSQFQTIFGARILSDIVLVLDHSDSTRRFSGLTSFWAPSVPGFASQFIETLNQGSGQCATGVVTFSTSARVEQTITNDVEDQRASIAFIADDTSAPFSGSNVISGIEAATTLIKNNVNQYSRKFMVVLLDSEPVDTSGLDAAIASARAADITVYAVSFRTLSGLAVNDATLSLIAGNPSRAVADRTDADLVNVATDLASTICLNVI